MATTSSAGTQPRLHCSPQALKRNWTDLKAIALNAKTFLGSQIRQSVTQDQQILEPEKDVFRARKRRRTGSGEPRRRAHRTVEEYDQALVAKDKIIQSLEKEIKALKSRNEDLREQISKKYRCSICRSSYNRSDGLYSHLKNGDDKHERIADERYSSRCGTCGKKCRRWRDLKKHMAVHGQKPTDSAGDLILSLALLKGANY